MTYTCSTCDAEITVPVEGVNAVTARGYLWCAKCVAVHYVDGEPIVEFLSPGKLVCVPGTGAPGAMMADRSIIERKRRCWRCGCDGAEFGNPYSLCPPCIDVVSPEEIAWMNDPTREHDETTFTMTPLGRPCGGG